MHDVILFTVFFSEVFPNNEWYYKQSKVKAIILILYCHNFILLHNLHNMSLDRIINKLINQSLTIHLSQNPSLIIISESPAHSLIVHVWFVLMKTPQS